MNITPLSNITAIEISNLERLDPVTVIFQDFRPGVGRLLIECYGRSWSAFWGSMGDRDTRAFVKASSLEYIVNKLIDHTTSQKRFKEDQAYLLRIIHAVLMALNQPAPQA